MPPPSVLQQETLVLQKFNGISITIGFGFIPASFSDKKRNCLVQKAYYDSPQEYNI